MNAPMRNYWVFDPKGKLRALGVTTGVCPSQLDVDYERSPGGDKVVGIKSIGVSRRAKDRGWRDADELFLNEGRADKIRAFEAYKQQHARGANAALPDEYLPAVVLARRQQVALDGNALELPPLAEPSPAPKAKAKDEDK